MEIRQKESVKAVTPKDKLRQNTNAGLGRLNTIASGTKADIVVNQQTAEMQRKQGQYRIAKKQYAIKRNNSGILRSKQATERTASAKNAANAEQHSNDYQEGKNRIGSTSRVSNGNTWEQPSSIRQPHHAGNTSGLTNHANVLLLKKATAELSTQKKTKAVQNSNRGAEESASQENENSNPQTPQRNIFDVANEEAINKIYHHGQRTAHQMAAQMGHHYRRYARQEQNLSETAAEHSQPAAQEQFKRTRNAQSLREKQDMRQMTARQAQTNNRNYTPKLANAMGQAQNPENRQNRILRGKSHLRDPTENAMIDSNPLNTSRYIAKLRSNQQAAKISSASHSAIHLEAAADSHAIQRLTAEQIQQKRKSAAIRNLLKKRLKAKTAAAQHSAPSASGYSISGSGSIFSLTVERRIIRMAQAAGRTIKSLLLSLVSAGTTILLVLAFFAAFAALLFSPFGIFFSGQDADNQTLAVAVADITKDFNAQLNNIEVNAQADRVVYHRLPAGEGRFITNWTDIAAVFAVRTAGGNDDSSMDVLTIDGTRIELLREIFAEMNQLDYYVETIPSSDSNSSDERVLHITITSKSYAEMPDLYHFTTAQCQALEEIMKPEYAQMLSELVGTYGSGTGGSIAVTDTDLQILLEKLPDSLSSQRQEVIQTAFSLVGKVNYFWGGKSHTIGWDSRWGTPTKVTAAGSRTTGTTRPFGLDCSGFVDWVFINAVGTNVGQGGGAAAQYNNSLAIAWAEAQAGDLVFYPDLGHVGIICGRDDNGSLLVVHCASSQNNVVVTGLDGFTKIRRPVVFGN